MRIFRNTEVRYMSLKIMPSFRMFFQTAFAAQLHYKSEGFFQRVLCSYTHKFLKCGAASLTELLELLELQLCLLELFCNSRVAQ